MFSTFFKYAPVQVISALSVFVLISVQTRYLIPEQYGLLAVSLVLLELVRTVCTQWLNTSMLRLYPSADLENRVNIAQSVFFMTLTNAAVSCLILGIVLFFYIDFTWELYLSLIVLIVTKSLFQFKIDNARLNENYKIYSVATLSQSLFSVVFTILLLMAYKNINAAVQALALSYIACLLFMPYKITPRLSFKEAKDIARFGIPIMVSGGIALLYSRADRLVMPKYLPMDEVGIYAAQANLLAGVMGLIFMVVAMPLYPTLARYTDNKVLLLEKHKKYLTFLAFISVPSLVGLCILDEQIITLFLGNDYVSKSPFLFTILAISFFTINFRQHYIDHGLQFLLKTSFLIPISGLSVLIAFSVLPFMLNFYGASGAALTVFAVSLLALVLSLVSAINFGYKFIIPLDFFKIIFSSSVMGLSILYFDEFFQDFDTVHRLMLNVFSSSFIYMLLCFILNVAEIRRFKKISI